MYHYDGRGGELVGGARGGCGQRIRREFGRAGGPRRPNFFFFFTFVTGPRRSLSLKLSG